MSLRPSSSFPFDQQKCNDCGLTLPPVDRRNDQSVCRPCRLKANFQPSSQGPGRGRRNKKAGAAAVFPSKRGRQTSPDPLCPFEPAAAAPKVRKMHTPSPFLR
jgi:hypothetical protein